MPSFIQVFPRLSYSTIAREYVVCDRCDQAILVGDIELVYFNPEGLIRHVHSRCPSR